MKSIVFLGFVFLVLVVDVFSVPVKSMENDAMDATKSHEKRIFLRIKKHLIGHGNHASSLSVNLKTPLGRVSIASASVKGQPHHPHHHHGHHTSAKSFSKIVNVLHSSVSISHNHATGNHGVKC